MLRVLKRTQVLYDFSFTKLQQFKVIDKFSSRPNPLFVYQCINFCIRKNNLNFREWSTKIYILFSGTFPMVHYHQRARLIIDTIQYMKSLRNWTGKRIYEHKHFSTLLSFISSNLFIDRIGSYSSGVYRWRRWVAFEQRIKTETRSDPRNRSISFQRLIGTLLNLRGRHSEWWNNCFSVKKFNATEIM